MQKIQKEGPDMIRAPVSRNLRSIEHLEGRGWLPCRSPYIRPGTVTVLSSGTHEGFCVIHAEFPVVKHFRLLIFFY